MRLVNVIRAVQAEDRPAELDRLRAEAEAGDLSLEDYLQKLMDGQEPTVQYFGGAHPSLED